MPTRQTTKIHDVSMNQVNCVPSSMVSAGIVLTSPALLTAAAAEHEAWLMLFSRSVRGRTRPPDTRAMACQNAKANRMPVIDMPRPQPIFRPT